ncbi:DUF1292 domain-containing protein [Metabacillus sediminilitoris]|jgi:hypothetical protein|uniref:DUF1292 domain-containing protein n=2 Tax=Metabacillus sediminilitoris TaxID=2567941 RepID=A0A4S4C3S6_9BACI|nr:DUF1292 domain-containing protein [Metabacillus sediminilitoris]THF82411.1 DUF1292 domain-containing protein [Metabacillus sediminilitoris]
MEVVTMTNEQERDYIIVQDESGLLKKFAVEALLNMEEQTYTLLRSEHDQHNAFVMQVENEEDGQYLIGIDDPFIKSMVLDAYAIAVDANPAD